MTTPKPKDVPRPLAKRSAIDPFIVMDVMGEANARELGGHNIIHMEVGQPATPAPRAARERTQQALESERLGYTEALGLPKLRERIARHLSERYGVGVRPERVVVTAGSSAGFVLAFLALLDKGDSLGLPSPGCYRQILKVLDLRPALIETSGQGRWMPTVADVERLAGEGAAGLLLASPNTRPAPWHLAGVLPRSLMRAGAIAFGSSPMRSVTGSNTRRRPSRRSPIPTRRSSSTASRNISA